MYEVAGEPVSVHDVAREIRSRLPGVGAKKLHKLCYFCQGHHLATFDAPLFTEAIQAWDMGPVVKALWVAEKVGVSAPESKDLTEAQLNTIGYVLSRYGRATGRDLEILSHNQAPWLRANETRLPQGDVLIPQTWIRDYFVGDGEETEVPLDSTAVRTLLSGAAQRRDQPARTDNLEGLRERLIGAAG